MKRGFTLVEIMATIVILTVVLLIAVPIYNRVREGINENIYDSKIKEVLAKAESYATENHAFVFDVKTLIETGEISADNETGIYVDPRTGRDMRCDIINAVYKENRYEVSITESDVCYNSDELENLYGMVSLKLYNENNEEIKKLSDTEWIREGTVKVRYEFKEEYKEYEENIGNIEWFGECNKENSTDSECIITTNEIQNATVRLELTINMDGVEMKNNVSENILVDLQRPSVIDGSVNVNNDISTNNERRVEFEISDGSGSGVRNYSIVKEKTCDGSEYEENKQTASDGIQNIYLGNGDYYICVEDKVGNKTSNEDLENPKNQIHVEGVDTSIPVISSFTIKSRKNGYNDVNTTLTISARDDGGTNSLEMCVSNSGYLQGCSWEKYSASKNWKVTGSLDGQSRTVYLSIRDSAGNIVNREAKYTVYKDCSNQKKEYTESNYGTCSKSCGGGIQYRAYRMKDSKTGTICTTGKDSKTCNTHSCDPVESMDPNDYESSKKVACDKSYFKRLVDENSNKFRTALDYQNFRNALYDCASVTSSILRKSDTAYDILRSHSRTTIVSGKGKSETCTCYYNKDSSSAERTCNKAACTQEHERFVSGNIYNGKILVLSATTSLKWPDWGTSSSKCGEDNGFGDCENETSSVEKWGYRSILIGDSSGDVSEATGWGACTKETNAIINWEECGSRDERKNRIASFQNGLTVGLYTYQDWYYWKNERSSRDKNSYKNGQVYVQIFKI